MEQRYYKYSFRAGSETKEILLALLDQLGFDSFEDTPEGWDAYSTNIIDSTRLDQQLQTVAETLSVSYKIEEIKKQNWNEIWESNFQPIQVENFCAVRADFHPAIPDVEHEIYINPKMAFGTGHHATTFMMLAAMEKLPLKEAKVLDYGCGTGILAILAAKLGSSSIEAVDIEWDAYENSLENCQINEVNAVVNLFHGQLEDIPSSDFNVILANINRNVILDSFAALYEKLLPGGFLLVSGILQEDRSLVLEKAMEFGFRRKKLYEREEWIAILFYKPLPGIF